MQVEADACSTTKANNSPATGNVRPVKGTLACALHAWKSNKNSQGQQLARFWAGRPARVFRQKPKGWTNSIERRGGEAIRSQLDRMTLTGPR